MVQSLVFIHRQSLSLPTHIMCRSIGAAFAPRPWAFILFLGMQGIGSGTSHTTTSRHIQGDTRFHQRPTFRLVRNGGFPCVLSEHWLISVFVGISIISSYFPPGKAKNQAFALLGAGQPIGYMIGMILGMLPLILADCDGIPC